MILPQIFRLIRLLILAIKSPFRNQYEQAIARILFLSYSSENIMSLVMRYILQGVVVPARCMVPAIDGADLLYL